MSALYVAAMAEIDRLMALDPPADSPDGARLVWLVESVERFERRYFPVPEPTPGEAAAFRASEAPVVQGLSE